MAASVPPDPRSTGRWLVIGLVAAVLLLWLGLDLTFRSWKARYLALAEFGASRVAPAIDPLASTVPLFVPSTEWRNAVSDTHAMLVALTGAGVLDESQMDDLRREVAARVAAARPETARRTLTELWDELESKAGPIMAPDTIPPPANSRHAARNPRPARPAILGPINASTSRGPSGSP
jgi:hypothetical protein